MRNDELSLTAWPSDMKISVDDGYTPLLELLFIRHLMSDDPHEKLPKISPEPGGSIEQFELEDNQWREAWENQINWLTHKSGPPPPQFTAQFGFSGFDIDAFHIWRDAIRAENLTVISEAPETLNMGALVKAWKVGLDTVMVLPFEEPYIKYLNRTSMIVSGVTRGTPKLYTSALEDFFVAANRN